MEGGENRISNKPWDSESESGQLLFICSTPGLVFLLIIVKYLSMFSGIIVQALCQIFDDLRTAQDTEFSVRVGSTF